MFGAAFASAGLIAGFRQLAFLVLAFAVGRRMSEFDWLMRTCAVAGVLATLAVSRAGASAFASATTPQRRPQG